MKNSAIQWTRHTYNPWLGCRKVAPECDKCYIVRQTPLRVRGIKHGSVRHRCAESTREEPLAWDRTAKRANEKHRVFCLSLGDWLDKEVPIEWFADLMEMVWQCKNLDWLLLTKRPQNFKERMQAASILRCDKEDDAFTGWLNLWLLGRVNPENVWIGVSAGADQKVALAIPANVHFLSCEPMLRGLETTFAKEFDWIIFGGESEPGGEPRPFDVIDLDHGLQFCRKHQIPAFVKQMGGAPTYHRDYFDDSGIVASGWRDDVTFPGGCTIKLSNSHGSEIDQWPERFRVREFPKAA